MTVERKPAAFGDMRGWIDALRKAGELHEVSALVDWDVELGTIVRVAQGAGTGPALLFNNIKDYNKPGGRCRRVFAGSMSSYRRMAMVFGMDPDTHPRELVKLARNIMTGTLPPKIVATGPVKENIVTGSDIDLFEFPTPLWNRADGGRYIGTYAGCVTKNPDTNVMNVGVYRGMIGDKNHIPIYMYRAQHIGHHALAWQQKGAKEMPIAYVIGWEPTLDFCAGSPVPMGVCEYDVMGAIRGAPVELVKCESHDLYVPATAEIVIEGFLSFDPETYMPEGPFAEFTGYVAGERNARPTIRVTAITHRNDPILRGTVEGALPKSYSENAICSSVMRSAIAWNVLDRAGIPGVTDVWGPPVHGTMNLNVQIKQTYRNQAKQVANAIWGSSAAHVRYKHVTVVDDDIDIHDYAAVDWAIAYRVNAGENDIVIMPSTFGAGLDPSTRKRDRNIALFGSGKWNRVLIDATINLDYDPDPDFGGMRFPPTVWPAQKDVDAVTARWKELGLPERENRIEGGVVIPFDWVEPDSLKEAVSLLDPEDSTVRPIAGGTALMLMMKTGFFAPSRLVSLAGIEPDHSTIRLDSDGSLRVGAMVSLAQLERSPDAAAHFPVMKGAIRTLSNIRVRNVARVGGALAHGDPHMDLPPLFAALGARISVMGPDTTREMAVEDLYVGYYQTVLKNNELIAGAIIPPLKGARTAYIKVTSRSADDWPSLNIGVRLEMGDAKTIRAARVVIGAAAEKVTRLAATEKLLSGVASDETNLKRASECAAAEAKFVSDAHGSVAYKRELLRVYLARAIKEALA